MAEPSADDARSSADRILSKPEYQEPTPNLIERGFDWINGQIQEVLGQILGEAGGYVVGYVVLAAAFALILWLLWRVMPRGRRPQADAPDEVVQESVEAADRRHWLRLAAAAEADGRFRDAVRARYRALLAGLVERHELPATPGATPREQVAVFAGGSTRAESLAAATDEFEDVWYGGQPADEGDVEQLKNLDSDVLPSARRGDR